MKTIAFVLIILSASLQTFAQIQVGVWTDKPVYQDGDTVSRTVTAFNSTLSGAVRVTAGLYNILGQRIRTLLDDDRPAGSYTVRADLSEVPSGLYWCRLQFGQKSETTKLVLVK